MGPRPLPTTEEGPAPSPQTRAAPPPPPDPGVPASAPAPRSWRLRPGVPPPVPHPRFAPPVPSALSGLALLPAPPRSEPRVPGPQAFVWPRYPRSPAPAFYPRPLPPPRGRPPFPKDAGLPPSLRRRRARRPGVSLGPRPSSRGSVPRAPGALSNPVGAPLRFPGPAQPQRPARCWKVGSALRRHLASGAGRRFAPSGAWDGNPGGSARVGRGRRGAFPGAQVWGWGSWRRNPQAWIWEDLGADKS